MIIPLKNAHSERKDDLNFYKSQIEKFCKRFLEYGMALENFINLVTLILSRETASSTKKKTLHIKSKETNLLQLSVEKESPMEKALE